MKKIINQVLTWHRIYSNHQSVSINFHLFIVTYFNIGHIRFSRVASTVSNRCSILATNLLVTECIMIMGKESITFHTIKVFNTKMSFHMTITTAFSIKTPVTYMTFKVSSQMYLFHVTTTIGSTFVSLITYMTFKLPHIRCTISCSLRAKGVKNNLPHFPQRNLATRLQVLHLCSWYNSFCLLANVFPHLDTHEQLTIFSSSCL